MKIKHVLVLFLILGFGYTLKAQNKNFGLGIIIGEPTGVSAKFFTGGNAIDAAAAWSFTNNGGLHVHADYLFHNYSMIMVQSGRLPFYYGVGARIKFLDKDKTGDEVNLGARFPVGLSYEFAGFSGDLFFEIVPILDLVPATEFDLNGALGFRYYIE